MDLDKASKVIDLGLKLELHAFALILTGAAVAVKGHSEVGTPMIMAGLAVFKGNR